MRVCRIALSGFRNYEWESFEFDAGTNVIRGKNGQGKTNLLEAVFMLTGGKSFRTRFDKEIVGDMDKDVRGASRNDDGGPLLPGRPLTCARGSGGAAQAYGQRNSPAQTRIRRDIGRL